MRPLVIYILVIAYVLTEMLWHTSFSFSNRLIWAFVAIGFLFGRFSVPPSNYDE